MDDNKPDRGQSEDHPPEPSLARWQTLEVHPYFWRVLVWPSLIFTILLAAAFIPLLPKWFPDVIPAGYWYLGSGGILLLLLALRLYWATALIRRARYGLDEHGYYLKWGVWWRSDTRIPYSRIQYVDVNSGPLERFLGLASLLVHTAGTRAAVVVTPGVPLSIADALRDRLLEVESDDGV